MDRYALLAALTELQVLEGLRTAAPRILPVVITTHGELCAGALRLQEWLTACYKERLLLEPDRDDGLKLSDLLADFRQNFHSSLLVAACRSHSDMLTSAGRVFRRGRVTSTLLPGVHEAVMELISDEAPTSDSD